MSKASKYFIIPEPNGWFRVGQVLPIGIYMYPVHYPTRESAEGVMAHLSKPLCDIEATS